jgi:hypothetical protein
MSGASPFRSGVETGCLIAAGLVGLLFLLGKIAQWTGAV